MVFVVKHQTAARQLIVVLGLSVAAVTVGVPDELRAAPGDELPIPAPPARFLASAKAARIPVSGPVWCRESEADLPTSVAISRDGKVGLLTGSSGATIWNLETGKIARKLPVRGFVLEG